MIKGTKTNRITGRNNKINENIPETYNTVQETTDRNVLTYIIKGIFACSDAKKAHVQMC